MHWRDLKGFKKVLKLEYLNILSSISYFGLILKS